MSSGARALVISRGWQILIAVIATVCAACHPYASKYDSPPLLIHHGPPVTTQPVDVLAVSPDMHAFLDRFVLPYESRRVRLQLLAASFTDSNLIGFRYDENLTLTASEAFEQKTGNCLAFANLAIALAREAGLDAEYQEVVLESQWYSREETVLVPKHVNVLVSDGRKQYVFDVSGMAISNSDPRRRVSDREATGLYWSNLGAEALFALDLSAAYANLQQSIALAAGLPDPWINLGVVYGRNWQLAEAEQAYLKALSIDPGAVSALSNLYEIYLAQGDELAAASVARKVERYRQKNPYHLLKKAELAMEEGRFEEAETLLKRALRQKSQEHRFHFALAQSHYLSGDVQAAASSLERARALAPLESLAEYQAPLEELMSPLR